MLDDITKGESREASPTRMHVGGGWEDEVLEVRERTWRSSGNVGGRRTKRVLCHRSQGRRRLDEKWDLPRLSLPAKR